MLIDLVKESHSGGEKSIANIHLFEIWELLQTLLTTSGNRGTTHVSLHRCILGAGTKLSVYPVEPE